MQANLSMQPTQAPGAASTPKAPPPGARSRSDSPSFQELMTRRLRPGGSDPGQPKGDAPVDNTGQPTDPLAQILAAALTAQPPVVPADQAATPEAQPATAAALPVPCDGQQTPQTQAHSSPVQAEIAPAGQNPAAALPPQQAQPGEGTQPQQTLQAASDHVVTPPSAAENASGETQNTATDQSPDTRQEFEILDGKPNTPPQPGLLFRDLAHTPVKVADAPLPDAESPQLDADLAGKIDLALENGGKTLHLKLTPGDLGTVTVELTQMGDGSLQVLLSASTQRGADLLRDHAAGLGGLLRNTTQAPVQIQVQAAEQEGQQQSNPDGHHGQQHARQQQPQHHRQSTQDFLQQLRLGIFPLETEAS